MEITFEGRPTQRELFETIIGSAAGVLPYSKIHSGGAIRGAKTFTNCLALCYLAKNYPNSKWSVHRKDLTILESTTIETFNKILHGLPNWKWSRSRSNYHLRYLPNDSRIFFVGANESRDPEFTDTLGLEINGCFFDQLEDVSQEYYNAVMQRLGSWHIPNEPQPISLSTFNPHPGWIKKEIHEKHVGNSFGNHEIYFPLSPYNEPSNTDAQWQIWDSLPAEAKARMIDGDWNAFDNKNPWFFAYDREKHVGIRDAKKNEILHLSFDFNISPATCIVAQFMPGIYCRVLKAYKIRNCTIRELCELIKADWPGFTYRVTGDPSGNSRNQGFNSVNETMYSQIRDALNIGHGQVDKPTLNFSKGDESWRELRVFCNHILQTHRHFYMHPEGCQELIDDIELATTEVGKDKLYKTSGETAYGMHLVDCFIYLLATYFNEFVKKA